MLFIGIKLKETFSYIVTFGWLAGWILSIREAQPDPQFGIKHSRNIYTAGFKDSWEKQDFAHYRSHEFYESSCLA